jgi:hypothetical protein
VNSGCERGGRLLHIVLFRSDFDLCYTAHLNVQHDRIPLFYRKGHPVRIRASTQPCISSSCASSSSAASSSSTGLCCRPPSPLLPPSDSSSSFAPSTAPPPLAPPTARRWSSRCPPTSSITDDKKSPKSPENLTSILGAAAIVGRGGTPTAASRCPHKPRSPTTSGRHCYSTLTPPLNPRWCQFLSPSSFVQWGCTSVTGGSVAFRLPKVIFSVRHI